MEFPPQQQRALDRVHDWMKDGTDPFYYLGGYAGTGKTTLAKHFAEGVNGQVQFASFTGKAALVMRQKGCHNACTIHSLIYKPIGDKSDPELEQLEINLAKATEAKDVAAQHQIRSQINFHVEGRDYQPGFTKRLPTELADVRLFVIDECSMVGRRLGEDLLSFGIPILVLGDPGQLPPVADANFFTRDEPNFMLTDIHRQVADSPIITLATKARQEQFLDYGEYGDCRVISKRDLIREDMYNAGQILVGMNKTRQDYNMRYRVGKLGISDPTPIEGDKVICLRNNNDLGLLNGMQATVDKVGGDAKDEYMDLTITPLDGFGHTQKVAVHSKIFRGEAMTGPYSWRSKAEEFDYSYAMTVHKSQGSQWDDVLLFDESGVFKQDKWKWLYTGITRAAKRITIVQ